PRPPRRRRRIAGDARARGLYRRAGGALMDAFRPRFLEGRVDPAAVRDEVILDRGAVTNGVLLGPSVKCMYIARVTCGETGIVDAAAPFRVELDMYVAELADLDLRIGQVAKQIDKDDIVRLWFDDVVIDAWEALVDHVRDHEPGELVIERGACVYAGTLLGY